MSHLKILFFTCSFLPTLAFAISPANLSTYLMREEIQNGVDTQYISSIKSAACPRTDLCIEVSYRSGRTDIVGVHFQGEVWYRTLNE